MSCGSPCNPLASNSLAPRLVVAAGGGGGGGNVGGVGGDAGQGGLRGNGSPTFSGQGGSAGTLAAGGAGGVGSIGSGAGGGGGSSCVYGSAVLDSIGIDSTGTPSVMLSYILPASVTLTSNPNPSAVGQQVTLTATVIGVGGGAPTPTGSVTCYSNGQSLGASPLNGSGVATLTTSFAASGAYALTVVYSGDATYVSSMSQVAV